MGIFGLVGIIIAAVVIGFSVIIPAAFRTVVSTNEVHIVQSSKRTVSFGKDQSAGNAYYWWPSWIPLIGVRTITLPMSVFSERLENYNAYDKDRLPFIVDIIAFFRITDPNTAAQRVSHFTELQNQLTGILQGAIRSILAVSSIQEIMEGRSQFGEMFTKEVDHQLEAWGVQNVKTIELMDIRDAAGSGVIQNIMAMKKSHIEMSSRIEVAKNMQAAQTAEIIATQEVALKKQDADRLVGVRTAETNREVQVAKQQADQTIRDQEKTTAEKSMAVTQVNTVRTAEIEREAQIVKAEQQKQQTILLAEGKLEATKLEATGILANGTSKAEAEKLMQLAPVQAQITLAKEIGSNEGYQSYLVSIRRIEAEQAVGLQQAEALVNADVKIIANTGEPAAGADAVRNLFNSKTGQNIGAVLEGFANTPAGEAIIKKLNGGNSTSINPGGK